MHDYHAVKALIERLTELRPLDGERVARVRIRAHPTLSPAALEQAYQMLTPGTALEGSTLVVDERLDPRTCPSCGRSWVPTHEDLIGHVLVCPACGTPSAMEADALIELIEVAAAPTP